MGLTPDDIQALLEAFEASTWQEMSVDIAGDHFHVSRRANGAGATRDSGTPPVPPGLAEERAVAAPSAAPVAPAPAPSPARALNGSGVAVTAPSVGLFWRAPSPGAPPFVEIGSRVEPDDTIAIIEVMKLMSPLKAGVSGVVTAILAENGATVARGDEVVLVDTGA
jgi:acetyl-CoA carboxylase biotin carboxyl carrier protein